MKIKILSVLLVFLLLDACETSSVNSKNGDKLTGSWTESFQYNPGYEIIFKKSGATEFNYKTSTLDLNENGFTLKVLPEEYVLTFNNDSLVHRLRFDTLVSGSYTVEDDVLIFYLAEDNEPHPYNFKVSNDSLYLNGVGFSDDGTGIMGIRPFDFIWGNSFFKRNGVFNRNY